MSSFLIRRIYILFSRRAQAALSMVFVIGVVVAIVTLTLAFLVISYLNSSFGFRAAQRAEAIAAGGAQDALLLLARQKEFANTGYCLPGGGPPPCASGAALVVVQNLGNDSVRITSQATVSYRQRTVEVLASVATSTGSVSVRSWKQI
jgi:uncharacterized protein (UPF0333 family)